MAEERLKLAVFIDYDNIQIGVKDTLGKEFDVEVVLEALKERGEVVTKVAYGDWHRAGDQSRQMTQHAVQMVQRNVTPRGDKNGADINLALDALEMAFTRHHINAFAIVGGDSDFIALVEKLKQYDKQVFVIGGRAFTSNILQRNCTEFMAYENLLKGPSAGDGGRAPRGGRRGEHARPSVGFETRPLSDALPNIKRALQILADRGVAPQLGLLKSTVLQLDSTFSERDYGPGSFLEFMQKMEREGLAHLRRTERGFLVELPGEGAEARPPVAPSAEPAGAEAETGEAAASTAAGTPTAPASGEAVGTTADALALLRQAVAAAVAKAPNRPLYMRQVRQAMRLIDKNFDERRYGFRGVLDLLHQAQREGMVKLQRDHKGVWRIFAVATPAVSAAGAAGPAGAPGAPGALSDARAAGALGGLGAADEPFGAGSEGREGVPAAEPVIQGEAAASTDFWESDQVVVAPEPGASPEPAFALSNPELAEELPFPDSVSSDFAAAGSYGSSGGSGAYGSSAGPGARTSDAEFGGTDSASGDAPPFEAPPSFIEESGTGSSSPSGSSAASSSSHASGHAPGHASVSPGASGASASSAGSGASRRPRKPRPARGPSRGRKPAAKRKPKDPSSA